MIPASASENKTIYSTLHDRIIEKRFQSTSPIRQYAHRRQYHAFVGLIPSGSSVLDAGCGEGVLSVLLAQHGCTVTGVDLSAPNIDAAKLYAAAEGVSDRVTFLLGDAEHLPVPDTSFDYVVSSHVLEHLPDFVQGVRELNRVARQQVIVAIPTCLNPASWVQLGGDKYWSISRRTPYAMALGCVRVFLAWVGGKEGVNESYAGRKDLIHIYRFPKQGRRLLEEGGLSVVSYRASSFPLPYVRWLVPVSRWLDRFNALPLLRNWGYGTTYCCAVSEGAQ